MRWVNSADDILVKFVYAYAVIAFIPLSVLGIRYNFASGGVRVTLSEFVYGFFILSLITVLSVGAMLGMWRDDFRPHQRWEYILLVIPVATVIIAVSSRILAGDVWIDDYVRHLVLGLFWFTTAVFVLSVVHIAARRQLRDSSKAPP